MGARVQRVQRVKEKVLRIDRLPAGGFLGLTGLRPEGCGIAYGHACGVRVQRVLRVLKFDSPSG